MVEIWAGDAQTVPEAHLGSAGASAIAPGAQIAFRRAKLAGERSDTGDGVSKIRSVFD